MRAACSAHYWFRAGLVLLVLVAAFLVGHAIDPPSGEPMRVVPVDTPTVDTAPNPG